MTLYGLFFFVYNLYSHTIYLKYIHYINISIVFNIVIFLGLSQNIIGFKNYVMFLFYIKDKYPSISINKKHQSKVLLLLFAYCIILFSVIIFTYSYIEYIYINDIYTFIIYTFYA